MASPTATTDAPLSDEFPIYFDNASDPRYSRAAGLLEVYYSPKRFATETICALVAATANISVLIAMRRAYDIMAVGQNRTSSAYSLLFVNLSVANSLSCVLSWLSNNSLFMFSSQLIELLVTEPCLFFIYRVGSEGAGVAGRRDVRRSGFLEKGEAYKDWL